MSFRYRNAPLVEAIFEFAPANGNLLPSGIENIRTRFVDYSGRADEIHLPSVQVEFRQGRIADVQQPSPAVRYRKWNADGSRMVQFGTDLCALNALRPYTLFEDYVDDMGRLVTAYQQEVGTERTSFVGQRYLNRIALPDGDPSDFFTLFPGNAFAQRGHRTFQIQTEAEALPNGGNVMLGLAYEGPALDGKHMYMLDIYARVGDDPSISFRWMELAAWQRAAHEAVERAFEMPLTQRTRELLGREER